MAVYLLGAGPGNPDLITVRGMACLRRAEVVVYDRLISRSLLAETRPDCERIYVGKEGGGSHAMSQEAISQLLVEKGRSGRGVVRLKGGDPFVFGRGGEEADALRRAGVAYEIIPGVSAGVGAPAFAGIPVTHRGIATAVAFVTGHEAAELSSGIDWAGLAASSATLVCYMGLGRLRAVAEELIRHGRDPQTPSAVIHWGTRPEQQVVTAPLQDLPERAQAVGQPALIVVGEVVALREAIAWAEGRPLSGRRVLIAFPGEQAEALADQVREQGGEPWLFPRHPGGPYPHEVTLLQAELAEGAIHQVSLVGPQAWDRLAAALGGVALLRGLAFDGPDEAMSAAGGGR